MLDSSPVALSPLPRPLKRSASVASLPTPPRTRHRTGKRRGRSRCSLESDSDAECDTIAFVSPPPSRKKPAPSSTRHRTSKRRGLTRDSPQSHSDLESHVAPVSPPPSRRMPAPSSTPTLADPSSAPVTPVKAESGKKRTTQIVQDLPVRDSPNNPFLDSPSNDGELGVMKIPRTPPPRGEKPTVTYVFRGVRGVYPNPLYNHAKQRPLSPPPQSLLPPEHPDYSPDMRCPPRLLFPKRSHSRHSSSSDSSHESQSHDESPTTPTRPRSKSRRKVELV